MICFPFEFQQLTPYPGYYYNTKDKEVYSIKSGTLKKLSKTSFVPFGMRTRFASKKHWCVSTNGDRHWLYQEDIDRMLAKNASVYFLPVKDKV